MTRQSVEPNSHIISSIISSYHDDSQPLPNIARTELDSHANMAVVGKDCFVFEHTGLTCDVSAFSPDLPITSLPIVDAFIVYDCPYSLQSCLLMLLNAFMLTP